MTTILPPVYAVNHLGEQAKAGPVSAGCTTALRDDDDRILDLAHAAWPRAVAVRRPRPAHTEPDRGSGLPGAAS